MSSAATNGIAIITGASGTLAPHLTRELESKGYRVIRGRRFRPNKDQANQQGKVGADGWLTYTPEQLVDRCFWEKVITDNSSNETSNVLLVNAIGQAKAPNNMTLEDVNVKPVVALASGGSDFAATHSNIQVTAVQISAIAAKHLTDAYGLSRKAADEAVVDLGKRGPDNFKGIALRLPYVFPNPVLGSDGEVKIEGLQPWSLEQVAQLPLVPLPGSGDQKLRPVSLKDVVEGIANSPNYPESDIIEAMGSNELSQREIIQLYSGLNNTHAPWMTSAVPSGVIAPLLDTFPHGLLDGFAVRTMAAMERVTYDDRKFTVLLGRNPQGMQEVHETIEPKTTNVKLAPPPIRDHAAKHSGKLSLLSLAVVGVAGAVLYSFLPK